MLLYALSTMDNLTGNEMVASELTFNMACSYLSKLNTAINGVKGKVGENYVFFENSKPKYLYDEKRGFLMKYKEDNNG